MITLKSFKHIFHYVFYALFLKNAYKHFLFFFSLIAFVAVLFPVFQTEWESFKTTTNIIEKSGKFDLVFRLPSNKEFLQLKNNNPTLFNGLGSSKEAIRKILQNNPQYPADSLLVKRTGYTNFEKKVYFAFETGFFANDKTFNQKIGKVSLTSGRQPSADPNTLEVVINNKFAKLKNIKLGDTIQFFDVFLTVVGFGDAVYNLSPDFLNTFKVNFFFNLTEDDNLFQHFGIAYVHESLFDDLHKKNTFNDFVNDFYLKFDQPNNLATKTQFFAQEIEDKLGFFPRVTAFNSDISSGARIFFLNMSLPTIGLIYLFAFILFFVWLCFITSSNLFKQKNSFGVLAFFGFSKTTIVFSSFLTNFLLLCFVSLIGFAFSFAIGDYFLDFNNRTAFINLEVDIWNWLLIFGQVVALPFLWALASSIFVFFKLKTVTYRWQNDKNNVLMMESSENSDFPISPRSRWSVLVLSSSKIKAFFSIFFVNFGRKLLLLLSTISLFLVFFGLLFIKSSADDFVFKQWNFLKPQVKSFAELKGNIYVENDGRIKSNVDFLTTDDQNYRNLKPIKTLDGVNLNAALVFSQDKIISQSLKNWFVDQSVEVPTFQNYMKTFGIDRIYFNSLVYEPEKDFLFMFGRAIIQGTSTEIYFMPRNWQKFLKVNELDSKLNEFQFQPDGSLGTDAGGVQYVIAPYFWKAKGYQLGDIISSENISFNRNVLRSKVQFKIAAFANKDLLIADKLFTDYDYLVRNQVVSSTIKKETPYNFLVSNVDQKHFKRQLIVNFANIQPQTFLDVFVNNDSDNLDLELLSLVNLESLEVSAFKTLSDFHFGLYRTYLLIALILGIFFLFILLMIVLNVVIDNSAYGFVRLLIWGYRIKKIVWRLFFVATGLAVVGLGLAFAFSSLLFSFLVNTFHASGVYIPLPEMGIYFLYALVIVLFVIFTYIFYNWFYLQKNSPKLIKAKL